MPGITMASTMGSTGNASHVISHFPNGQVAFKTPGPKSIPSRVVGSASSRPSWTGLTSIWETHAPPFKDGGREKTRHTDVSNRHDSLTRSRNLENGSFPSPRGNASLDANNSIRHAMMPDAAATKSNDPALASGLTSLRHRQDVYSADLMDTNASTLSNATLLSGSDPDDESSDLTTYSASTPSETIFRAINVANVNEFVPGRQQSQTRSRVQEIQFGATGNSPIVSSTQPLRTSNGLHADSRAFVPAQRNQPSAWHSQARTTSGFVPVTTPMNFAESSRNGREGHHALHHVERVSRRESDHRFVSCFSGLQLNGSMEKESSESLVDAHFGAPNFARPMAFTAHSGVVENEAVTNSIQSTIMPGQSHFVTNHSMHGINGQVFAHNRVTMFSDTASTVRTPSGTPPTTSGSQQSIQGSGSPNQRSSEGEDSCFHNCDLLGHVGPTRYAPPQAPVSYSAYEFVPPAAANYVNPYGNHLLMGEANGEYSGRRRSKEGEKEQNMSAVLRDFRMHGKAKDYELKDVYNHIVEFSGDQHGSRFIQSKLETANSDEKEQVFAEIQDDAVQLMTDIFGNYVIQKMFEHGTQAQKRVLASSMRGRILFLTSQVYGCRVVQKALEHVLTDQQAAMVKELENHVLAVVENQNGNHVIQKAIERVPGEYIQFIFDAHRGHIVRLSRHNYGCRVIQRMLEYGSPQAKRNILIELQSSIPALIEDQYGNYVMQHIIRHGEVHDRYRVVATVQQQLLFFSKHKFASNVVETAIECAESQQRQEILARLTTGVDQYGQSQVYGLLRDQFGNYVIQKVINSLDGPARRSLIVEIEQYMPQLRKIGHGKQISALEKTVADAKARDAGWTMPTPSRLHLERT